MAIIFPVSTSTAATPACTCLFSQVNVLPLSVKTFLRIFQNPEFDLVSYNKENINLENINKIKEPVFMRFGTVVSSA